MKMADRWLDEWRAGLITTDEAVLRLDAFIRAASISSDPDKISSLVGLDRATDAELEAIISHSLPGHPDVHALTDAQLEAIARA